MTLVEFLTARLDEDEAVARETGGAPWSLELTGCVHVDSRAIADNKLAWGRLGYVATVEHEGDRQHVARHDPARVLREVAAKRRILVLAQQAEEASNTAVGDDYLMAEDYMTSTLKLLALPYADHEDYRPEWGP